MVKKVLLSIFVCFSVGAYSVHASESLKAYAASSDVGMVASFLTQHGAKKVHAMSVAQRLYLLKDRHGAVSTIRQLSQVTEAKHQTLSRVFFKYMGSYFAGKKVGRSSLLHALKELEKRRHVALVARVIAVGNDIVQVLETHKGFLQSRWKDWMSLRSWKKWAGDKKKWLVEKVKKVDGKQALKVGGGITAALLATYALWNQRDTLPLGRYGGRKHSAGGSPVVPVPVLGPDAVSAAAATPSGATGAATPAAPAVASPRGNHGHIADNIMHGAAAARAGRRRSERRAGSREGRQPSDGGPRPTGPRAPRIPGAPDSPRSAALSAAPARGVTVPPGRSSLRPSTGTSSGGEIRLQPRAARGTSGGPALPTIFEEVDTDVSSDDDMDSDERGVPPTSPPPAQEERADEPGSDRDATASSDDAGDRSDATDSAPAAAAAAAEDEDESVSASEDDATAGSLTSVSDDAAAEQAARDAKRAAESRRKAAALKIIAAAAGKKKQKKKTSRAAGSDPSSEAVTAQANTLLAAITNPAKKVGALTARIRALNSFARRNGSSERIKALLTGYGRELAGARKELARAERRRTMEADARALWAADDGESGSDDDSFFGRLGGGISDDDVTADYDALLTGEGVPAAAATAAPAAAPEYGEAGPVNGGFSPDDGGAHGGAGMPTSVTRSTGARGSSPTRNIKGLAQAAEDLMRESGRGMAYDALAALVARSREGNDIGDASRAARAKRAEEERLARLRQSAIARVRKREAGELAAVDAENERLQALIQENEEALSSSLALVAEVTNRGTRDESRKHIADAEVTIANTPYRKEMVQRRFAALIKRLEETSDEAALQHARDTGEVSTTAMGRVVDKAAPFIGDALRGLGQQTAEQLAP